MRLEESRPERIYFDNIEILGQKCNSVLDMHMVVELAHKIYVNFHCFTIPFTLLQQKMFL